LLEGQKVAQHLERTIVDLEPCVRSNRLAGRRHTEAHAGLELAQQVTAYERPA
jgi:hypothetical protein